MMIMQIVGAGCVGLFFGILFECFRDVNERMGHFFLGVTIFSALLTALFFLACTRFYGEAVMAVMALCIGGFVGWAFSRFLNLTWRKNCSSQKN
ncbi:MAG: hypothetical protein EKK48_22610 [Candidatus Melainabacteria bacterium]|nr:MAG: hypothetical protein EKK48_22610 [Candidatus Melainabacteria bacterium]